MLAIPVFAHHGTNISYDNAHLMTIKGTVTEFVWANPHCQIYFDVKDEKGKIVHWAGEGNSPYNWAREGWNKRTLKPGDDVSFVLAPSKAGTPVGVVRKVIQADGKEILQFGGQ